MMELGVVVLVALVAFAAVVWPLLRGRGEGWDPHLDVGDASHAGEDVMEPSLRAEIDRYRGALRAGTVCGRCATANPPESRFCTACGFRLDAVEPLADDA